jgi:NAD(P)-dependent dehydrogenase (short-subunit alcohol dehydrogenase family)
MLRQLGERFAGRVCLITGSTGIAEATALRLAAEGATIFVATRTAANGEALATRVREAGRQAASHAADLSLDGSAQAALDACLAAFGRVDAVFNVAGGSGRRFGDGPVHEADGAGWDATLDLNARSLFLVCGAAVRAMLAQPRGPDGLRGAILNMSSILAQHPSAAHFPTHAYAASKGSIEALSRAMAARYAAEGIRVNSIAPSLTMTPMAGRAAADPATQAYATWKQPLAGGFIDPADVAAGAAFLLSSDAARITGQVLTVDGGWSVVDGPPSHPSDGMLE